MTGKTFAPHWDTWAAQEDALLARERTPERADIVMDGTTGCMTARLSTAVSPLSARHRLLAQWTGV